MASRKHLPAEERRAATVAAVLSLAADRSPDEITTAAIAGEMNVTQGALFRHFPNKGALWEGVMKWISARLMGRVDASIASAPTPLAALESIFESHIEFVCQHPGVPRMMFSELQRPEDSAAKRIARSLQQAYALRVSTLLEDGKASGEIDAEVDVISARVLFIGAIQGLVVQSLLADENAMRNHAAGVFACYRRAIENPT